MTALYSLALLSVSLRTAAFYKDDPRPVSILLALAGIWTALAFTCFQIDGALVLALSVCVLPNVLVPILTERFESRITCRLLLSASIVVPFVFPQEWLPRPRELWHALFSWMQSVPSGGPLVAKVSVRFVLAHLTGLLLCLSDCNLLLRFLLRLLDISPPAPAATLEPSSSPSPDVAQYLRGGLVGAIERLLVYLFAANAAFNAIAFVITVKGIVRYQEIVKNHSAEYVLIGTLLSTLMAMLLGMLFVRLT